VYGELIAHADDEQAVNTWLQSGQFEVVTIELKENMRVSDRIESLRNKKAKTQNRYQAILEKARGLFRLERDLQFAYDALLHKQEREVTGDQMSSSNRAVVLTGWIPKSWAKVLEKRMSKEFPEAALAIMPKKKKESL